jgi:hypothetical protein
MTVTPDMTTADNTFGMVSYGQPTAVVPASLTLTTLSSDEMALVTRLTSAVESKRYQLEIRDAYYRGTMRIQDLGIAIPPQMRQLKVALGWPRVCVDALDERLNVEGFRFNDATEVDLDLQALWQANSLDGESQLAHVDSLVFGQGFVAVGSGDDSDTPLISVESPLDIAVEWDARTRKMLAALRLYGFEGRREATLYLPDQTIFCVQDGGDWKVMDRDQHKLGVVSLVRIANRPRSYARDGASEITPEIMSITDAACRTLQGLEVAREFYSAPQRYILGAQESDFQNADGTAKSGWETYMGRVLALERDADGEIPTVGQFTAYDPTVFTKVIDMYAKIMSSITGLPPHVLGYTTDNPASADAIRSTEMRLKLKADRKTKMFGESWRDVMKLALLIRDGSLPANADSITTVWADTATPTPAATTDAIFKQVEGGMIPATSDVTLEKLGYTAVERQRLEQDRLNDQGQSMLEEIAHSLSAKALRIDTTAIKDAEHPGAVASPAGPVTGKPASGSPGSA